MHLRPFLLLSLGLLSLGLLRVVRPVDGNAPELALQQALVAGVLLTAFLFLPAARYRLAAMPAVWTAALSAPGRKELLPWGAVAALVVALSLLTTSPVPPGLTQIQQAERRIDTDRPREALEALQEARRRGYSGADMHNLAGIASSMAGDDEGALRQFSEAARLAPRSPTVWRNRAVCLAGMQRWEEAAGAARRALSLNPELRPQLEPLLR
jgi:tetratricopeptide (TPR) repeat protein